MTDRAAANLVARARALGVTVPDDDLERLLEVIHQRESDLMLLRHAITRKLAGMPLRPWSHTPRINNS